MDTRSILDEALPDLGYELVSFELTAQDDLRIFTGKEGGITVEDYTTVSSHLSRVFMVGDIDYERLEISSLDPDRLLEKATDFIRFTDQDARIKIRLPIDGQKDPIGRIEPCKNDIITVSFDDKATQTELSNIDRARLRPEFEF